LGAVRFRSIPGGHREPVSKVERKENWKPPLGKLINHSYNDMITIKLFNINKIYVIMEVIENRREPYAGTSIKSPANMAISADFR
jgi:hypothetical protein